MLGISIKEDNFTPLINELMRLIRIGDISREILAHAINEIGGFEDGIPLFRVNSYRLVTDGAVETAIEFQPSERLRDLAIALGIITVEISNSGIDECHIKMPLTADQTSNED